MSYYYIIIISIVIYYIEKTSFDAISNSYSATINLCSAISNALTDMSNIHLWITSIEMVKVSLGRSHEY